MEDEKFSEKHKNILTQIQDTFIKSLEEKKIIVLRELEETIRKKGKFEGKTEEETEQLIKEAIENARKNYDESVEKIKMEIIK
jgi:hypothetical protein